MKAVCVVVKYQAVLDFSIAVASEDCVNTTFAGELDGIVAWRSRAIVVGLVFHVSVAGLNPVSAVPILTDALPFSHLKTALAP